LPACSGLFRPYAGKWVNALSDRFSKTLKHCRQLVKYELLKRRLNATRTPSSFEKSLREDSEADFVLRTLTFTTGERPYYAFGSYLACMQAKALGHSAISLFEFGVAGGNGLISLERIAAQLEPLFEMEIGVYGFDLGSGLPETEGYKDLPYWWRPGEYRMDVPRLQKRLQRAKLIIGNVRDTIPEFMASYDGGVIGFCGFDVDYYSSQRDALQILQYSDETRLPRTILYFDDIYGASDLQLSCEDVGQARAVKEFNETLAGDGGIYEIDGLCYKQFPRLQASGGFGRINAMIRVFHDFRHNDYCRDVNPLSSDELTQKNKLR
jgi:hypothetical protein